MKIYSETKKKYLLIFIKKFTQLKHVFLRKERNTYFFKKKEKKKNEIINNKKNKYLLNFIETSNSLS